MNNKRPIRAIAQDIFDDWSRNGTEPERIYFGARPYLDALSYLDGPQDVFGADSAKTIVLYFLANATTWRGAVARTIKAELKAMIR